MPHSNLQHHLCVCDHFRLGGFIVSDMNLSSVNFSSTLTWYEENPLLTNYIVAATLCITINYINGTLIHTFRKYQILHSNPRYILFIHLVINDMMWLFLSTLLLIISYTLRIFFVPYCIILLIISIIITHNSPLNLAGMAIECYIAVCMPLRHGQICTVKKTYILIGLIWAASALSILPDLFILLATEPLQFFHSKVRCVRDFVFRSTYSLNKRDASHIVCLVVVWLTLIYTYARIMILFAARALSTDKTSAQKARNTILLHGAQLAMCMLSYVSPSVEVVLHIIFPGRILEIRFANYLIVYILPRFLSPIIYGVRDKKFREYLRMYFLSNRCRNKERKVTPEDKDHL
uniref:G-protein coupled receptors family 1 profile domain-containing protein n=1 Tax=Oreochromis niloticus TaxID=8128 RepID=I3JCY5_ORENI